MKKVLFLPFEASRYFTYKYEKNLILEYPLKSVMSIHSLDRYISENSKNTLGFLFLRQDKNSNKSPFAEIIINNIYKPKEIKPIWDDIINLYINNKRKVTISQVFYIIEKEKKYSKESLNIIKEFIIQKNNNDEKILESIKIRNNKCSGNSKLLWFSCSILENFSCSNLNINGINMSMHSFLQSYSPYRQSVVYEVPINNYFQFRTSMKRSVNYSVGEEAKEKAFENLKKNFTSSFYPTTFKSFSEPAWRDLLCNIQFNYQSNNGDLYKVLMHLLLEKVNDNHFELIDYDTEVSWETEFKGINRKGSLDAYLHLKDKGENSNHYKYYFEFKTFNMSLSKDKDCIYQPIAVKNNDFEYARYFHSENDNWSYVAVTEGTKYSEVASYLSKENYLDLSWKIIFETIMVSLYPQGLKSADKSLMNFLFFLIEK